MTLNELNCAGSLATAPTTENCVPGGRGHEALALLARKA